MYILEIKASGQKKKKGVKNTHTKSLITHTSKHSTHQLNYTPLGWNSNFAPIVLQVCDLEAPSITGLRPH